MSGRGKRYIDGSIQDALRGKHSSMLTDNGRSFLMDYKKASHPHLDLFEFNPH